MATQGLISVTCDGEVVMKLVVGCNGFNAPKAAGAIRAAGERPRSEFAGLKLCRELGFGCADCRVVVTADAIVGADAEAMQKGALGRYRETFADPQFNPRWEHGTADYVEIVAFQSMAQLAEGGAP